MICVFFSFIYLTCAIFGIDFEELINFSPLTFGFVLLLINMIVLISIDLILENLKKEKQSTINGPINETSIEIEMKELF